MSRKNRNASSRNYTSFNELKNTTVHFDLTKGKFKTKLRQSIQRAAENDEVRISLVTKGDKNIGKCLSFSVREDLAETLIKGYGRFWVCGIVSENVFERLYLIPDENGYAMYTNEHGKRYYVKPPVDTEEIKHFEKYVGSHKLMYDDFNKAYYIVASE